MESHYRRGEQSVLDWIKHHHADYAAPGLTTDIKEGNPSAASFMKFQAFTTAAVQDQRIRTRMQQALTDNIEKGQSKKDFAKVIDQEFDKAGLTKLNPHQIDNIYYTNTSLAFGAGQMGKMIEVSGDFPAWKYSATMDGKTRPSHAALHGKIFRNGDFNFWPPIGFRCRCTAIPLTARQLAAQGGLSEPLSKDERESLSNAEFTGNKNQKYMKWLAVEYAKSDLETKGYIDRAIEELRKDIQIAKSVNGFTPAKNINEAIAIAKSYGINQIEFADAELQDINNVLSALHDEKQATKNINLDKLIFSDGSKMYSKTAFAEYEPKTNRTTSGIYVNTKRLKDNDYTRLVPLNERLQTAIDRLKNSDEIIEKMKSKLGVNKRTDNFIKNEIKIERSVNQNLKFTISDLENSIKKGEKPIRFSVSAGFENINEQIKCKIHHEFGHHIDYELGQLGWKGVVNHPSTYAKTNRAELIAEFYAKYRMEGRSEIPGEILKIFEKWEKKD